jgi:hypothetical protein
LAREHGAALDTARLNEVALDRRNRINWEGASFSLDDGARRRSVA